MFGKRECFALHCATREKAQRCQTCVQEVTAGESGEMRAILPILSKCYSFLLTDFFLLKKNRNDRGMWAKDFVGARLALRRRNGRIDEGDSVSGWVERGTGRESRNQWN